METYKMIQAGEISFIEEEERVIEILGRDEFEFQVQEAKNLSHSSIIIDDIEIWIK